MTTELMALSRAAAPSHSGVLNMNADDWGRSHDTTERILDCMAWGAISSVSAMVFMEDSERAATCAMERGIDAGLHLNLTSPFTANGTPSRLSEHQQRLSRYLRRHRLTQTFFHPGLIASFEYVVAAQLDEFSRCYGAAPTRIDGHHHMHLCANVLLGRLLPPGTIVRRNFSVAAREKSLLNRFYRKMVDRALANRHLVVDRFYSLRPLDPSRLRRIFSEARRWAVEIEVHPAEPREYQFLASGEMSRLLGDVPVASHFALPCRATCATVKPDVNR